MRGIQELTHLSLVSVAHKTQRLTNDQLYTKRRLWPHLLRLRCWHRHMYVYACLQCEGLSTAVYPDLWCRVWIEKGKRWRQEEEETEAGIRGTSAGGRRCRQDMWPSSGRVWTRGIILMRGEFWLKKTFKKKWEKWHITGHKHGKWRGGYPRVLHPIRIKWCKLTGGLES